MKYLIFSLITVVLTTSCSSKSEENDASEEGNEVLVELTEAQFKNTAVQTGLAETKSIKSKLKVFGKIVAGPENVVSVSVPLGAYLKSIKVVPGKPVQKGEVIALVEDPQFVQLQQDYLTAKAQFTVLESEYNRQSELNASKASSDKVFEQTKAAYLTQQILVKSLEEKLQLIGVNPYKLSVNNISKTVNIVAPISGFISEVNANVGKYIHPTDVLVEIIDPKNMYLSVTIFEKDFHLLQVGQPVIAYTNEKVEDKYEGVIDFINPNLTRERSTEAICRLKSTAGLYPGSFMNAEVEVVKNDVLVLPEGAVVRYDNKQYVFVERGVRQYQLVQVEVGNRENGFVQILNFGEYIQSKIVTQGAYSMLMVLKNSGEE